MDGLKVVVVVVTCCRGHVGAYGDSAYDTPHPDRFARTTVVSGGHVNSTTEEGGGI
jgi:hypothetical protein